MNFFKKAFYLYYDGFTNLKPYSKKLWLIILLKVFIIIFILKLFFYSTNLNSLCKSDQEKSNFVINNLIKEKK